MPMNIFTNTIKGVKYKVLEYNWSRNEYDLTVDGVMVLDGKPKDECISKILELADDNYGV